MTMNDGVLKFGRECIARGWPITPLHGKRPMLENWPTRPQMTDGELREQAYRDRNYGIRTGNGLIGADVDAGCDPALLAQLLAIHTPTVRTGSGGYHFYFAGDAKCSVGKVSAHLDIRGDGGQLVGPGSIHPDTGEPYVWLVHPDEAPLAPYPLFLQNLEKQATKLRNAPKGTRNAALNKAAYMAAKGGASTGELADVAAEIGLDRRETESTLKSGTEAGAMVAPKFNQNELLVPGEHFMGGTGQIITVDQTTFARECWDRLPDGKFVSRFGICGQVNENDVFEAVEVSRFRMLSSEYLPTYAWIKNGKTVDREYRVFSADMGNIVLSAAKEHTENIEAIVRYPLAGGPHKGWLVRGEHPIAPVTDHAAFWREILCDFPFRTDHDRWVIVAGLLTLVMRPLISGPVPPLLIQATRERTGKSLLVTDVFGTFYGRDIPPTALPEDDVELNKILIAKAFGGHTINFFDNVAGRIDSSVLAAYSTARRYTGRILGLSKEVDMTVNAMTILTANNPTMSGEIAKRMLVCALESRVDRPETRTDFKHQNLRAYLLEMRPQMLGSLLAIAAMKPGKPFIMGGYEEWGRAMGCMEAAGMPLSQDAYLSGIEEADDKSADTRILMAHLVEHFGGQALTGTQVLAQVKSLGVFPYVADAETEHRQVLRMGHALRKLDGQVFDGWQIKSEGSGSRRQWRLRRV